VNLFVTDKLGSLTVLPPRVIHTLIQRAPGSAYVHNSFALTVCLEVIVWRNF